MILGYTITPLVRATARSRLHDLAAFVQIVRDDNDNVDFLSRKGL